jgi:hypothetical protein
MARHNYDKCLRIIWRCAHVRLISTAWSQVQLWLECLDLATGTARRELSGVPHSVRVPVRLLFTCEAVPIKMFALVLFPLEQSTYRCLATVRLFREAPSKSRKRHLH